MSDMLQHDSSARVSAWPIHLPMPSSGREKDPFDCERVVDPFRGSHPQGAFALAALVGATCLSVAPALYRDVPDHFAYRTRAVVPASDYGGTVHASLVDDVDAEWSALVESDLHHLRAEGVDGDLLALVEPVARAWGRRFGSVPELDYTGDGSVVIRSFGTSGGLDGVSVEIVEDGIMIFNVANIAGDSVANDVVRTNGQHALETVMSRIASHVTEHGISI